MADPLTDSARKIVGDAYYDYFVKYYHQLEMTDAEMGNKLDEFRKETARLADKEERRGMNYNDEPNLVGCSCGEATCTKRVSISEESYRGEIMLAIDKAGESSGLYLDANGIVKLIRLLTAALMNCASRPRGE